MKVRQKEVKKEEEDGGDKKRDLTVSLLHVMSSRIKVKLCKWVKFTQSALACKSVSEGVK